jgi:hypothetical protein
MHDHLLFLDQWCSSCVHARPYTVLDHWSSSYVELMEIARLGDIGVLENDYTSEWASTTFAIAKKVVNIRAVSDFRKAISIPYKRITNFHY